MPRRPSIDSSSAVSSPQTKAPAALENVELQLQGMTRRDVAGQASAAEAINRLAHPLHGERVFRPHVDYGLRRADGIGRDRHALDNPIRERLHEHAVHEGPRIAFVAVAKHVFGAARGLPHEAPFGPRGKAGPASAPQPALTDFLDHVGRLHRFQASPQGREAAAGQVLVKVQRIAAAEMLGGDMDLRPEEGRHVRLLRPHGMGLRRHSWRIVKETIERPGDKAAEARADAAGPKMPRDQGLSGRGGDVRVDLVRPPGDFDLDGWGLFAH